LVFPGIGLALAPVRGALAICRGLIEWLFPGFRLGRAFSWLFSLFAVAWTLIAGAAAAAERRDTTRREALQWRQAMEQTTPLTGFRAAATIITLLWNLDWRHYIRYWDSDGPPCTPPPGQFLRRAVLRRRVAACERFLQFGNDLRIVALRCELGVEVSSSGRAIVHGALNLCLLPSAGEGMKKRLSAQGRTQSAIFLTRPSLRKRRLNIQNSSGVPSVRRFSV
jgi:hypothetical protein